MKIQKYKLLEQAMRDYPAGTVARFYGSPPDHTSTGVFKIMDLNQDGNIQVMADNGIDCFYADGVWAKPTILTGKCAVQVNNPREFKILMDHYTTKTWAGVSGKTPEGIYRYLNNGIYPKNISYHDYFESYVEGDEDEYNSKGYKTITFSEFANEIGIDVPMFVLHSEDKIDMYVGDECFLVFQENDNYKIQKENIIRILYSSMVFSNQEYAEQWIKDQNKQIITDNETDFPPYKGKSLIPTGKYAIYVSNEREFGLLMDHYEHKGWVSIGGNKPHMMSFVRTWWSYNDKFGHAGESYRTTKGLISIPFSYFAREIGIEVPIFVMISEDTEYVYSGDTCFLVYKNFKGTYNMTAAVIDHTTMYSSKIFKYQHNAQKWINDVTIEAESKNILIPIEHIESEIERLKSEYEISNQEKDFVKSYGHQRVKNYLEKLLEVSKKTK